MSFALRLGVMTFKDKLNQFVTKPWYSALMTVVVLFVIGVFIIKVIETKPAEPIVVSTDNLSRAEVSEVEQALQPLGHVQFFSADLPRIQETVASLSWVENVSVSRDWYRGVTVLVTPRKAIANFGSERMLDSSGATFVPVDKSMLMNANLVTLHGNPADAKIIMKQLHQLNVWFAPLGMRVKDLSLTARQTWIIQFSNGIRVVVDREDTERKLYELPKILKGHYKNNLHQIKMVDLRYKNGFVIAWKNTGG